MKKFYFAMSVDDVALRDWCKPDNFRHLVEFFSAEKIPATFFVVPVDETTDQPFYTLDSGYKEIIGDAMKLGFDFQQHGLRHNRFELGIPPIQVLNLPHETENKRYAEENRAFLEQDHSVKNCRDRLAQGRKILENALGISITGFRAPALQQSPAMFEALAQEGYDFDSSALMQWTAYDYYIDRMDTEPLELTRSEWLEVRSKFRGQLLPLTCDYTWFVTKEKYGRMMAMAKHDLQCCLREDIPFVTVCHVDPVHEAEGLNFLRELYGYATEAASAAGRELEFVNLKQLSGILSNGK